MKRWMIAAILSLFMVVVWGQPEEPPYPNYKLYQKIREFWLRGDSKALGSLMGKRVKIDLQILPDSGAEKRHDRDKAVGILAWYFERVEVLEFRYDPTRMSESRGMAIYRYRMRETGVDCEGRLYFYLREEEPEEGKEKTWLITAIHEIGSSGQR